MRCPPRSQEATRQRQPPPLCANDHTGLRFIKTDESESIAFVHMPDAKGMPTLLYSHGNAEDLGHSQ